MKVHETNISSPKIERELRLFFLEPVVERNILFEHLYLRDTSQTDPKPESDLIFAIGVR